MGESDLDDLLDTVDVTAESGDDDAAWSFLEDFLDASADVGFGRGIAFDLGVGGIGHEQIHAFRTKFGQLIELKMGAYWRQVDLKVARFDNAPLFGVNANAKSVRDGVGDAEEGDDEVRFDGDDRIRFVFHDLDGVF